MLSPALKRTSALVSGVVMAAALTALTAPAAHATEGAGSYVALGDSYAAGAGVPGQSAGLCLRSDHNYGHLVAAALKSSTYTDVTCSAAKVKAITSAQYDAFIRVNDPQLDGVRADTGLITLGIGGNDLGTSDLGIGEVIATCVAGAVVNPLGTPCHDVYGHGHWDWNHWAWEYGEDDLVNRIDAAAPQLADALQRIHAKALNAKILVVGYPSVLPDNEWDCLGRQPVTVGDVAYLRGILGKLNTMLAATSAANGATYVDTMAATKGHDVCSDDRWIEGALPGSPAVPFHPNATGEQALAGAVLKTLGH
ncbi:SGNH/GDSL hydrolase family protein [Kitasatospora atroaurantiaca]|uniref:GDSL-like lipase/acylhydrolase family protein n=1 Tax=Kitasatospora atroaurantiaca TaxID=285545 RepID=A0A561ELA9_9ACTN|nr:SGNH/GDSL hydrolase family protein [Kitasatospora atroaurantiaca]TWE16406.1 GDSL-like lipase/acylhydrolase family protein [Kitasatospora atroaurantiaca]